MVNIISIVGRARAGKDTVADYIVAKLPNAIKLWHSYPIKKEAMSKLGITLDELEYYKNNNIPYHGVNIRRLLQEIADTHREEDPLYYVKAMENSLTKAIIYGYDNIVISDTRYNLELDNLLKIGGPFVTSIKVVRGTTRIKESDHSSEAEVDSIRTMFTVDNDGSLGDLKNKIDKILYR